MPALLASLVALAQQCLGFRGDLAPNSGAHSVHCTNICVGSRPGAVSGAEPGRAGPGFSSPALLRGEFHRLTGAGLTSSSPGGFVVPHLFLPELHQEQETKLKMILGETGPAPFIRVQT